MSITYLIIEYFGGDPFFTIIGAVNRANFIYFNLNMLVCLTRSLQIAIYIDYRFLRALKFSVNGSTKYFKIR